MAKGNFLMDTCIVPHNDHIQYSESKKYLVNHSKEKIVAKSWMCIHIHVP